jgi:sulfotransferase family protein
VSRGHPPAPFVVGVGRSGTTLLRLMLDAHPELTIPPETHFVPELIAACGKRRASAHGLVEIVTSGRQWGDFGLEEEQLERRFEAADPLQAGDALRAFYGLYAERVGKPRWGDKTPIYVEHMREIHRALPEARFVHLIRDGRDVALSRTKRALGEPPPARRAAKTWMRRIADARRQARRLPHYMEARYEDLVLDTESTLRRVCEFIELRWDPAVLDYHEHAPERLREMGRDLPARGGKTERPGSERLAAHALAARPPEPERVGAWRDEMDADQVVAFEEVAGGLLAELGYDVERSPGILSSLRSRLSR